MFIGRGRSKPALPFIFAFTTNNNMQGDKALKRLLSFIVINYSHVVDPAAFLRETENCLVLVQALVGNKEKETLDKLWNDWHEALESYSNVRQGWKDTWHTCAKIRSQLMEIMRKYDLLEITTELLNIDKIQIHRLEEVGE